MSMNIYHVARTERVGYDEMASCVVVAQDSDQAREVAAACAKNAGYASWQSASTYVRLLGVAVNAHSTEMICVDFNAG